MKCGGFSKVEATSELVELIKVVETLKPDLESRLIQKGRNGTLEYLELIEAHQQGVAGLNYWFKVKVQENGRECVFIKVYRDLKNNLTIQEISHNKEVDDVLEFYIISSKLDF